MNILYYNSRGLANEFERALERIKWDVAGVSELRREEERLIKRKNGNYFYYFGETKGHREIGFYINKNASNTV